MTEPFSRIGRAMSAALFILLLSGAADAGDLSSAISPTARSVSITPGGTATATVYATVINRTDSALGNCTVDMPRGSPLDVSWVWTNAADNSAVPGSENTPFSLDPRGSRALALAFTANDEFDGIASPVFECSGGATADVLYGVNTLALTVSETAPADILAIGIALPNNDGVIRIANEGGRQAMAVAAINIGAADTVTVRPVGVYGLNDRLPATLTICESGPDGRCLASPVSELSVSFAQSQVRTFSVFAQADSGIGITLAPANTRVEVRFLVGNRLAAAAGAAITAPGPSFQTDQRDALRLAQQATFGPTSGTIEEIRRRGIEGWIDHQLTLTDSSYADLAGQIVNTSYCSGIPYPCSRDHFSAFPLQMRFFEKAVHQPDQLRQRVAFALSQILVVSEYEVNMNYALATYNQMLLDNAFGNYRDILEGVARSPVMGDYLDTVNSRAEAPAENFPRELLQLFGLGETLLNPDGTPVLDNQGRGMPAYSEQDVLEVARALTGWVYPTRPGELPSPRSPRYYDRDMSPYPAEHDNGPKIVLGVGLPAGQGADADLESVIAAVYQHPNVAPFVSRQLIQHLVMSNPPPDYVARISAVFENNGAGVRGDLRAVVRAILLDPAARTISTNYETGGKLRDPVLLTTSVMRLVGARTDGYAFLRRISALGQVPFESPSVFNFYPPDFALPGGEGLQSPSQALMNLSTVYERHNLLYDWTYNGYNGRWDWNPLGDFPGSTGTQIDWTPWGRLAQTPERLIDTLDAIALEEDLTPVQRAAILESLRHRTNNDPLIQAEIQARQAIYLIVTSPQFQIDH